MSKQVPAQYPSLFPTRIAFIGEAPGSHEEEKGIPLVGPAGRVFNAMLRTANLDRAEFYIGHVFNERIPEGNIRNWTVPSPEAKANGWDDLPPIGSAGYLRPEHRPHLDRLMAELADVRPTVIVPLGPTPLWAFTGTADIGAQRGTVTSASLLARGVKVIPTFDPTSIMKLWKFFVVGVGDILKAYDESAFPEVRHPEISILIEPTLQEVLDYVPKLLASDLLSVDIETGWGQITNIGFAPNRREAINIPFVDLRQANKSYWKPEEEVIVWGVVKQVMENRRVPKLGQNFGGYDAYWFLKRAGIKPYNFRHDTRLIHHALYPELPKDLEFMGASYTPLGAWKKWGRKSQEKRDA